MNATARAANTPHAHNPPTMVPILRASHRQIRELAARRSSSVSHYQGAIEADPAVALNLFVEVNRKLKRAGRSQVSDVQRAILFTGISQLPNILVQASVFEDIVDVSLHEASLKALSRAHHASRQAQLIGSLRSGLNVDELLAMTLTRESLPYIELLNTQKGLNLNLQTFAHFIPALPDDHDVGPITKRCTDLAAQFADATERGWDEAELKPLYDEIGTFTTRESQSVAKQLRRVTIEAARAVKHFPNYPAANQLMLAVPSTPLETTAPTPVSPSTVNQQAPVQPAPERSEKPIQTPAAAKPAAPMPQPPASPPPGPERRPKPTKLAPVKTSPDRTAAPTALKPAPEKATLPAARTAASAGGPRAESSQECPSAIAPVPLQDVLKRLAAGPSAEQKMALLLPFALQAMCDHTSAELAVILMPVPAGTSLLVRAHRGLSLSKKIVAIDIPLAENPLLKKLLKVDASIVWQPDRHRQLISGLPLKLMGDKPGMLYSVVIAGRPMGVIVACRPPTTRLNDADFDVFKQLCSATKTAFERARQLKVGGAG